MKIFNIFNSISGKKALSPLPKSKSYSVLFIGNSYTKRNNMSFDIFSSAVKAAGYSVEVSAILNGGHTLEGFADPGDEFGALVEKALDSSNYGKYDFVVIQEQSLRPVIDVEKFYTGTRALANKIKAIGATPIMYSTWGRKTGSVDLETYSMTNESMTWKLAANYTAIAEELSVPVAHVGLAFYDVYTGSKEIELYDTDLFHPAYNGSYLAAMTILAKIFRIDPTTVKYDAQVPPKHAKILRKAARDAVFSTPEIPVEYRTSSAGIGN